MRWLALVIVALTMLSCSSVPECVDNAACSGEFQACIDETCEDVQCTASSQCNISEYCDPESYTCRSGCLDDVDCISGQYCDTAAKQCVQEQCTDTVLDCPIGTICNQGTGTCDQPNKDFCEECLGGIFQFECDDGSGPCLLLDETSFQTFCFPTCSTQSDCPAGYQCAPLGDGTTSCIADCNWLQENGWL